MTRLAKLLALCFCAALLAGCVNADQRFVQGAELEQSGQRAAAVQRYLQALQKDPEHVDSRQRLALVAPVVVNDHLEQAANDRRRGAPVDAAEAMLAADHLIKATRAHGLTVHVQGDYAAKRRTVFDLAIAQSMRDAQRALNDRHWREALSIYQRINAYQPDPQQAHAINQARTQTHIHWAQAERASGHFNTALNLIDQALEFADQADHDELYLLSEQIVHEGTQRVLFLPVFSPIESTAREADFAITVNDSLHRQHWREMPPLIEPIIDVAEPRMRRYTNGRRTAPGGAIARARTRAIRLGHSLDADLVVLVSLQEISQTERVSKRKNRTAKMRNGAKAHYQVRQGHISSHAQARYEIIPITQMRAVINATVSAKHSSNFTEAHYQGDVRQLLLSRAEQALFDSTQQRRNEHQLDHKLASTLAARIAKQVVRHLQAR